MRAEERLDTQAKRYFRWRFAHPWLSTLAELPIGVLNVLLFWLLFGGVGALVGLALLAALELLSLPSKLIRSRMSQQAPSGTDESAL